MVKANGFSYTPVCKLHGSMRNCGINYQSSAVWPLIAPLFLHRNHLHISKKEAKKRSKMHSCIVIIIILLYRMCVQCTFVLCFLDRCRNVIIIRVLVSLGKVSSKLLILYHKLESCVPPNMSLT